MEKELVSLETAKLAKERGFLPHTITTKFTNDYLLGGKNVMINESCILVWMCELQKWFREYHNIHIIMKPVLGSKNGYDSYPMLGWDYDIVRLNRDATNSYYMGYPIGDWFTATEDRIDEGDTLADYHVHPKKYEEAFESGLLEALKLI